MNGPFGYGVSFLAIGIDMVTQLSGIGGDAVFDQVSKQVVQLVLATVLGSFLGLEREWSQKSAGIRTFALISLLGAILAIVAEPLLLAVGAVLVLVMSVLLAVQGLLEREPGSGLSLTTSVSMFVAYGVGVLAVHDYYIESVTVAVLSSLLLVLKRELHEFAWDLSYQELQSAIEFSILAFVIYPLLPEESFGPWNAIDARTIWLLVIAISAIGFVNYILVKRYQGRGLAATGFFGGLVNSTAVIAEMAQRAVSQPDLRSFAVGAILLANAAMAFRNAILAIVFIPAASLIVGVPLAAVTVAGITFSFVVSDWGQELETDFSSPFSLRNALGFGALFLVILVVSAGAEATFGLRGFLTTSFLSGLVSSGTSTATAVTLVETGQITNTAGVIGVLVGTFASILIKVVFAATIDRDLVRPVLIWNAALIFVGVIAGVGVLFVA